MSTKGSVLLPGDDPYQILQVRVEADDQEIRAAYLRQVTANPPDRSPEQFERIRDSYELLRDPERRIRWRLFSVDPDMCLPELLGSEQAPRQHVGPGPWLVYLAGHEGRDESLGGDG